MKRANVEPEQAMIPVSRQCELQDLSRSSFYYEPSGETEVNLTLMRLIDEQFTKRPFYGVQIFLPNLSPQTGEDRRARMILSKPPRHDIDRGIPPPDIATPAVLCHDKNRPLRTFMLVFLK